MELLSTYRGFLGLSIALGGAFALFVGISSAQAQPAAPAAGAEQAQPAAEAPPAQADQEEPPPTQAEEPPEQDSDVSYVWGGDEEDEGEEPSEPSDPWRVITMVTGGASVRFVNNIDYGQQRFAPSFVDAFGALIFPGPGHGLRHGVGLGASINLTGDGNSSIGVDPVSQLVLTPSYVAYLRLSEHFVVDGHAGLAFDLTPDPAIGLELAAGGSFMILAGFGVYAELSFAAYMGEAQLIHPIGSAELGVMIDYEVLP